MSGFTIRFDSHDTRASALTRPFGIKKKKKKKKKKKRRTKGTHTHARTHTHAHMYTHTHMYTHVHTHVHTHTHTCTHTHTQIHTGCTHLGHTRQRVAHALLNVRVRVRVNECQRTKLGTGFKTHVTWK